ncbi:GATA transcription factor areB gamma [Perkinsela sp. CCAP 1560/4]|nr:GATA transcription factor areB gamma [Perkinsela sp. CCAP 1560/4]|eukprot:KNH07002.1 GATA transcription factor areB gamma [Perkinsela sp. CCAP 1560/4]
MIVFPVQGAQSPVLEASARNTENEPTFNGYVLRSSVPYEEATESDSNLCLSSEHENDESADNDDVMKYIQQFDSPLEDRCIHRRPETQGRDSTFGYPYMCILKKMVRLHHDLFIVPTRGNLLKSQLGNCQIRRNHSVALECINALCSLDEQHYLSPIFSFLRKLILLGVRENEEKEYTKNTPPIKSNGLIASPVLAWLEDSIVKILESVLTTHFITTDIAATARKIWSALPELLHSFGIAPQRLYLRSTEAMEKLPSVDGALDAPVDVSALLQAVENYDEMECQQIFSFDVLSISEYLEMIPFPITLPVIRQKHDRRDYATLQQIFYDLYLMLVNCFIYNPPDTEYYAHAKSMLGFLFTWMANDRSKSNAPTGGYDIHFEEHIVNGIILDRLGSATEMLAPKAKLMRDHVATEAIEFSKQLSREIGQFAYLKRDFTLPELPHEISKCVTQAREAALVQTIPLSHPTNAATNYLFACIDLVLRYEWNAFSPDGCDSQAPQADLSQSNFLNLEGFLFDSQVVDQFPLMKHAYWCTYTQDNTFDAKLEKNSGRQMASSMIRKVLEIFPHGRRLLEVNQFFKSEET